MLSLPAAEQASEQRDGRASHDNLQGSAHVEIGTSLAERVKQAVHRTVTSVVRSAYVSGKSSLYADVFA